MGKYCEICGLPVGRRDGWLVILTKSDLHSSLELGDLRQL